MITIPEVESAQPDKLVDASRLLSLQAAVARDQIATAERNLTELASHWQGDAATAASARGRVDVAREQVLSEYLVAVQWALRDGGNALSTSRTGILESVSALKAQGWDVASDGTVSVKPGGRLETLAKQSTSVEMRIKVLAVKNTATLKTKLAEFTALDEQTTEKLSKAAIGDAVLTEQPTDTPGGKSPGDKGEDKDEPPAVESTDGPVPISTEDITYDKSAAGPSGAEATEKYIDQALDKMGITDPTARENWKKGYMTLTERETSHNANLVPPKDAADQNNTGGINPQDGEYVNATRGIAQLTPDNFAKYHQPGTSNNIYDPVAQICASMNYVMDHPNSPTDSPVSRDGHDLADNIQQADSRRPAHWY